MGLMLWVESGLKGCCGGLSNRSVVEGYRGGVAVVAVDFRCVVCFAWWFDWQWWIRMWVCCVCVFCLVCLLCVCVCVLLGGFAGGSDGLRNRETGREIERNNKKIIKKECLNEVLKKIKVLM